MRGYDSADIFRKSVVLSVAHRIQHTTAKIWCPLWLVISDLQATGVGKFQVNW